MPGAGDAGITRLDRMASLRQNFGRHGIAAKRDTVPGIGHNGYALLDPVKPFFCEALAAEQAELDKTANPLRISCSAANLRD